MARRQSQKNRLKRLQKVCASAKITLGCAHCEYSLNPDGLIFDHIVPVKSGEARRVGECSGWRELWRELLDSNVQVLCGTCHSIKSAQEKRDWHASNEYRKAVL